MESISALHLPRSGLTLIGLITVKFLYQFFFFNAAGEETGWRGFALPRLQAHTSPLIAALIIGFFLGFLALLLMAGGRKAGLRMAILG
ncbi:MAG: CPBP family glutamic-type intramembrane protease [Sphingobacterium sp.]|nr:CPBP family glutamic-type intramembrane protease [Sphingobacterium sp.]